jgi:HEAT repeat protein
VIGVFAAFAVDLTDPDPRARLLAIHAAVGKPPRAALHELAAHLPTEDEPDLRRATLEAMARLPLAQADLVAVVREGETAWERAFAARALGADGSTAAGEALLVAVRDGDATVRVAAFGALARSGTRPAIPILLRAAVHDPDPAARDAAAAAAEALAAAPTLPPDVPAILAQLRWGQDRAEAARALGRSGDRRALEPLVEAAAVQGDVELRRAAVAALGRLGDGRAVPPLLALLGESEGRVHHEVIGALAALRDDSAAAPLAGCLRERDAAARQLAVRALGWIDPPGLFALLAPAQSDAVESVRAEVLFAVQRSRQPERIDALRTALGDVSPFVRAEAARLLGEAGLSEPLVPLLADRDRLVRLAAADALAALGSPGAAEALTRAAERARDDEEGAAMRRAVERVSGQLPAAAPGR